MVVHSMPEARIADRGEILGPCEDLCGCWLEDVVAKTPAEDEVVLACYDLWVGTALISLGKYEWRDWRDNG